MSDANNTTAIIAKNTKLANLVCEQMEQHGISQAEVARQSSINASALSPYLKGTYKGNVNEINVQIKKWLNTQAHIATDVTSLLTAEHWADTPTSRTIMEKLMLAHVTGDMVMIYGNAGVGKNLHSRALRQR